MFELLNVEVIGKITLAHVILIIPVLLLGFKEIIDWSRRS